MEESMQRKPQQRQCRGAHEERQVERAAPKQGRAPPPGSGVFNWWSGWPRAVRLHSVRSIPATAVPGGLSRKQLIIAQR